MRVRMRQCLRGPKIALDPGDIYDGDPVEMARWCARGVAEALQEDRTTPEKPLEKKRKKATLK